MNISDLKIGKYVVVNDLGASKYSSGMRVIGKVVSVDPCGNSAIIESLPKHRYEITDFNDFELWSKQIEDKTERMGLNKQTNDLQQRKRKDNVNSPSHYNFGDIEVVDFIDQVTKHYNSDVAYHIGNAIKYISRAPHKNGKEDVAKAKWSIERAFENWDVK
ncbi:DUF3310 domain-containing protein [Staphylococcus cohnii]|uniref:DUF3310 domain-containing protein n=1 Tax=Staphylococcus cohnii TaxID=29382 RepID=UPI0007D90B64|nr:DUF3310 domain-containing protein [Staphylococcus cohnii]OAO08702.1 hypothetical protein A4A82_10390 [Staphylococcus cohnii]